MPEVDGCGNQAKAEARKDFAKEMMGTKPVTDPPSRLAHRMAMFSLTTKPAMKEHLRKKMDEKLQNFKKERSAKKKS